ncbi:hypothetical protein [Streptomyces syringium]|uniref:hypothetical protein n=1 Tax=Streptomyces syringium TaxID=76729 RepID=UPI00345640F0
MPVDHNDVNFYRPNEASPIIVNPDGDTPKSTEAEDRTKPTSLTWSVEAGVGRDTTFSQSRLQNDNKIGDRNQPAVYFHLQSDRALEPGEVVSLAVNNIEVYGTEGEERMGKLLVQHDANDQDWPQTAAQGRIGLPLSANPEKSVVEYPTNSGADLFKPMQQTSLLTYSITGESGKPITAGVENNLEFVATNPEPDKGKSVWVAFLALLAKADGGQESLCLEKDLKAITAVPPTAPAAKKFRTRSKKEVDEEARKQAGWQLIAGFESYVNEKVTPYVQLKPGESVSFKLKNVVVSPTSGVAPFLVIEYAVSEATGTIDYKKSPRLNSSGRFTKMGASFFFDYLSTDQPEIPHGSRARLVWSAENVKKYGVYAKEQLNIEPGEHAKDTRELTEATPYLLEAFSQEDLSFTRQTVAAIHNPSSTFHNVTVKDNLDLNHTGYTKADKISYSSNQPGDKKLLEPAPVNSHEGDRFAVVGISGVKNYTPAQNQKPGLDLLLERPGRQPDRVGTLYVDPKERRAVGIRIPAKSTLIARPNSDVGQTTTLEVDISFIITAPRALPPLPKN